MRRRCLLLVIVCCVLSAPIQAGDWPRFLGPAGDGKSTETGLDLHWSESGPQLVWEVEVGDGYTMPAIADGRLFEFDRRGDQAHLICREAATGKQIWSRQYLTEYEDLYGYSTGPRGTPVVDGDRVYTYGVEGKLRCHAVRDGELIWEVDTVEKFNVVQNFFGVGTTPIIEGDLLITMVGGSPKDSPKIQSGEVTSAATTIVGLDKMTGEVRYTTGDDLASYSSPVLTTFEGRRRGLLFARGGLLSFNPADGSVDFQFPWRSKILESVNASNPVVVGDRVLITECYGPGSALLRLKKDGYEVLRKDPPRDKSLASHWATPIHHEGTVYGCSGRHSGEAELRAIDFDDGKVAWSHEGLGRTTMIHVQDHLIVLGERGRLFAIEATPKAYKQVSASDPLVGYPAWNPPVLANGLLYIRGADKLRCYDLRAKTE
jgi:outer membrane protein assembly factor BamB